jgi:hypothetical protein
MPGAKLLPSAVPAGGAWEKASVEGAWAAGEGVGVAGVVGVVGVAGVVGVVVGAAGAGVTCGTTDGAQGPPGATPGEYCMTP